MLAPYGPRGGNVPDSFVDFGAILIVCLLPSFLTSFLIFFFPYTFFLTYLIPYMFSKVKYTSICIARFYANHLKCAQTWITQFYLQITPCLPLLPSRRTSPPFGWYSFYRPIEGRRLSRPGWLVTYRNKVPPRESNPDGHPPQY